MCLDDITLRYEISNTRFAQHKLLESIILSS